MKFISSLWRKLKTACSWKYIFLKLLHAAARSHNCMFMMYIFIISGETFVTLPNFFSRDMFKSKLLTKHKFCPNNNMSTARSAQVLNCFTISEHHQSAIDDADTMSETRCHNNVQSFNERRWRMFQSQFTLNQKIHWQCQLSHKLYSRWVPLT